MSFSENGVMAQMSDLHAIQARAVAYGATDVEPREEPLHDHDRPDEYGHPTIVHILRWPADSERISLDHITYDPSSDTFAGWGTGPVPEWVQR